MPHKIEWLGHCCFRITTGDGIRILIDPFDDSIGYRVPDYNCDVLLLSHGHYDSGAYHLVPKPYELIDMKGEGSAAGIGFKAFECDHDTNKGKDFGKVLIFVFEIEGIKYGYFSHIGVMPRGWQVEEIGRIDVAFVPVGGIFALGASQAKALCDTVRAKIIFPMHFKTDVLNFTLAGITEFERLAKDVEEVEDYVYEVSDLSDVEKLGKMIKLHFWPGTPV